MLSMKIMSDCTDSTAMRQAAICWNVGWEAVPSAQKMSRGYKQSQAEKINVQALCSCPVLWET